MHLALTSVFFYPVARAYMTMPVLILYQKMVPAKIEGLMVGLIQSIMVFNTEILMRLVSLMYLLGPGINMK